MDITVRFTYSGKYAEVDCNLGSASLNSGLLDQKEQSQLAAHLREVADELDPPREDFRALCAELLQELCCHYRSWELKEGHCSDAMNRARAALG